MDIRIFNEPQKIFHIANGRYRTLVSGKDTDGKYAVIEMTVPPGAGPKLHAHKEIEEVFYIASGTIDFRTEAGVKTARQGNFVRIPEGGAVHGFTNHSAEEATLICTVYPAGMEEMFELMSTADPSQAKAIAARYGSEFFPDDYFE